MAYSARILADSIGPSRVRLTTMEVTFPRIVLAEFNTHRMFSRNSASSRAIPVEKLMARVMEDPFVPVYWGKNQRGMQADQELSAQEQSDALEAWHDARDLAVAQAQALMRLGVHKQIANRLLEPFMWHTVIVTATEWENFFALRCHRDAQPEIRRIAEMMRDLYTMHEPEVMAPARWHLPLCEDEWDLHVEGYTDEQIARISCARCARVSYLTHDGKRDPVADLDLADRLQRGGHMSPFEHAAYSSADAGWYGNFRGWHQYRKMLTGEAVFRPVEAA